MEAAAEPIGAAAMTVIVRLIHRSLSKKIIMGFGDKLFGDNCNWRQW